MSEQRALFGTMDPPWSMECQACGERRRYAEPHIRCECGATSWRVRSEAHTRAHVYAYAKVHGWKAARP